MSKDERAEGDATTLYVRTVDGPWRVGLTAPMKTGKRRAWKVVVRPEGTIDPGFWVWPAARLRATAFRW